MISEDNEDFSNDPEMLRAIEMSMADIRAQESQHLPRDSSIQTAYVSAPSTYPKRPTTLSTVRDRHQLPFGGHSGRPLWLPTPSSSTLSESNAFGSHPWLSKRSSPPSSSDSDDGLPSSSHKRKLRANFETRRTDGYPSSVRSSQSASYSPYSFFDDDEPPAPPRREQESPTRYSTDLERRRRTKSNQLPAASRRLSKAQTSHPMPERSTPRSACRKIVAAKRSQSASRKHSPNQLGASAKPNGDIVEGNL